MKCAAWTTNGRTAAAYGCGESTITNSVVSRTSFRIPATWSGISVNAPSIEAVNSIPATSLRIVAEERFPPMRPESKLRTLSVSTATQRRPLKSASTSPQAFDSRRTRISSTQSVVAPTPPFAPTTTAIVPFTAALL